MVTQSSSTEYRERYDPERIAQGITFLRALRSSDLRRMAAAILPAVVVGEAGEHSLTALVALDLVLAEREIPAA